MDTDVMVVGAGPTGLLLASELRLAGASVLLLDRLTQRTTLSRAGGIHSRTMEILDQRGLLDPLLDTGNYRPMAGHFAGIPFAENGIETFQLGRYLPQTTMEGVLEQHLGTAGLPVHRDHDLVAVAPDPGGVTATFAHDGGRRTIRAAYLVGADGAHSTVRSLLGIDFPGWAATATLIIADVRVSGLPELETMPDGLIWRWADHGSSALLFPFDGHVRLVLAGPKHSQNRDVPITDAEVRSGLHTVFGPELELEESWNCFRIANAARQVAQYRHGRVFFAGDAAHVHAPLGGQGMNTGMQDAANLGWKLGAAVSGWGSTELLDSYHSERHPVAQRVLFNVRAQSALVDWAGTGGPDRTALRQLFTELMRLPDTQAYLARMVTAQGVRYPMPDAPQHPLLGSRAADLELDAPHGRLYEVLRSGRGALVHNSPEIASAAAPWGGRSDLVRANTPDSLLIRPDGYVCWAASSPESLASALVRWFGTIA